MLRFYLFVALLLFTRAMTAQNLIINPSFENYNRKAFSKTCKFIFTDSTYIEGWSSCGNHALSSWHKCSSEDMYLSNQKLGIKPYRGKWMIGFTVIRFPKGNNEREYLTGQLTKPLKFGSTYQLTFFLSPRDGCQNGLTELGVLFNNSATSTTSYNSHFTETPQLTFSTGEITQKGHWYKVQLTYTAAGGEQYITIGNYKPDLTTELVSLSKDSKTPDYWNNYSRTFYFIDDVELLKLEPDRVPTLYIKD